MCAISWQAVGHGGDLGDDGEGGGSGEGGGLGGDDDRSGWLPSDLLPSGGGDDAERPASPKCKKAHHAPQQSKSPTAATLRQRQSGAMRGLRGVATFCVVGIEPRYMYGESTLPRFGYEYEIGRVYRVSRL